jgi:hypothetical protein
LSLVDRRPFRLDDPDARELLKTLLDVYFEVERVKTFAQGAGVAMASITWQNRMEDVWPELLQRAAETRKLRALVKVVAEHPNSAAHAALFQRLLVVAPAPVGETPAHLLPLLGRGARRPFIDRDDLRTLIMELVEGTSRVLVVTGPGRSGKSYSWYLISHVSERLGSFSPYPVDLSSWAGPPAGPVDVMREVANLLNWELPAMDATAQEDTHARILTTWFVGRVRRETEQCWLVFDGLNAATMTDAALRLIENIAVAAERQHAGELRVVLIAHTRPLPEDVDPFALRDTISHIGVTQLRAFFTKVAAAAGQAVDEAGLDLLMAELLGPGPPPNPLPLPSIAVRAAELARAAFPAAGSGGG